MLIDMAVFFCHIMTNGVAKTVIFWLRVIPCGVIVCHVTDVSVVKIIRFENMLDERLLIKIN